MQANRILQLAGILLLSAVFMLLAPSLLLDRLHISLYIFDIVVLAMTLAVPIYAVLKFKLTGIIIGSIYLWLMLIAEGDILSTYDHERGRILDYFWHYTGWIVGLVYCTVIYAVMLITREGRKAKDLSAAKPNSAE
jgi:hypothetical protein